ncbi:Rha family transcriptional regulator [uncultured Mitsuokella sp.]|uniref:Rha family transcriptional regulator n=1 Tax=uncultured Mitsuokella sp. TaxID=453120 RepID=UPI002612F539|nr:Rha family transcriptional regulator [uncultured Mitsuokella sp.]
MGDLTKVPHVLDSREVAEMVGKRHANLIRDIENYIEVMGKNSKLSSSNFFIERTYKQAGNGKEVKRYDITKKGCEMVANKLTGEKGIIFTAEYVERFNQMEKADKTKHTRQITSDKAKEMRAEAMLRNSISKQAKIMLEIAKMSGIKAYQDVMMAKAGNMLAGENVLPMPKSGRERQPLGWFCKQIGKPTTWATQLGKILKIKGIEKRPGENGEFVEDHARGNHQKQVQNFEWYVDYLLPIVQKGAETHWLTD